MQEETSFCQYCRAKLVIESEIEQGYHNSCYKIMMEERHLTLIQVVNRFSILTHDTFKIVNISKELDYWGELDFDFVANLEENTLYLKQQPTKSFEYLYLINIDTIPFELSYFSDLKVLKISNDYPIRLNDYLPTLSNLTVLDIEYREDITGLEFIGQLQNLNYLRLAGPLPKNFIFTDSFRHLKDIKFLELESFDSPNLIETLENYNQLKKLNLTIGIIKEPFGKLESLEEVKFSNVRFTEGFFQLFQSQNLRNITFSNCPIESFPDSFSERSTLETLLIINCPLNNFPHSLSLVEKLRTVELKATKFTSFPYDLQNIRSIRIDTSLITEINSNIKQCKYLTGLSIINSPVTYIDSKISSLRQLKVLTISGTEITSLPDELDSLNSLEVLDLSNNNFQVIPKVVCKLKTLKILILDRSTDLLEFPDELSELVNLERLSLKLIPISEKTKRNLKELFTGNPNIQIIYY